jgi:hypothetical protein
MTDYLDRETLGPDPDEFMGKTRYKITYQCERCGHKWSRVTTKLGGKDPACPVKSCQDEAMEEEIERRALRLAEMLESRRAPAQIGNKPIVAQIDRTAQIVMEDHGLTDLKDNIREGESMAPSLPSDQQRKVDGFFGGNNVPSLQGATHRERQMKALGRKAIAGAFKDVAINPNAVLGGKQGESPLRSVGVERLA